MSWTPYFVVEKNAFKEALETLVYDYIQGDKDINILLKEKYPDYFKLKNEIEKLEEEKEKQIKKIDEIKELSDEEKEELKKIREKKYKEKISKARCKLQCEFYEIEVFLDVIKEEEFDYLYNDFSYNLNEGIIGKIENVEFVICRFDNSEESYAFLIFLKLFLSKDKYCVIGG